MISTKRARLALSLACLFTTGAYAAPGTAAVAPAPASKPAPAAATTQETPVAAQMAQPAAPAAAKAEPTSGGKGKNADFVSVKADGTALALQSSSFKAEAVDKTIRGTLTRWCLESGWHLSWELRDDQDMQVDFAADFGSDFYKAVDGVLANVNANGGHVVAVAYEGNKVVRILSEGVPK
ncbi:hypothetical protein F6X40_10750 [Paraburkholderia sp. UCT31]|uniref:TcpQ domain-containing protein n=1 Tax=Paraburkholderia sp. UCT31 TaxID=2615209 RepID=UPI0016563E18|nr:TcpQ domain-containing protein [Paraburkholderia sp. UCT31]MBC8737287.1 hypothetical protein [Paraburkholderia sp. UCT31]